MYELNTKNLSQIGAVAHLRCSALTGDGVNEVHRLLKFSLLDIYMGSGGDLGITLQLANIGEFTNTWEIFKLNNIIKSTLHISKS